MNATLQKNRSRRLVLASAIVFSLIFVCLLFAPQPALAETPRPHAVDRAPIVTSTTTLTATLSSSLSLEEIANDVAEGVGVVKQITEQDPNRVVFLFEDFHSMTAGQVEIAVMLNRLYERYGLRTIGREAMFVSDEPPDTSWINYPPPFRAFDPVREREDTLVQLLQDGEVSASEFIALVYHDVTLAPLEKEEEYWNLEGGMPSPGASEAPFMYVISIGVAGLSPRETVKIGSLLADADALYQSAEAAATAGNTEESERLTELADAKIEEARMLIIQSDPWVQETWERLNDQTNITSTDELLALLDEIKAKADEVGADVGEETPAQLDELRKFYEARGNASVTMAEHTNDLGDSTGQPVAIHVGAAHSDEMIDLLTQQGVSVVVLRNTAIVNEDWRGAVGDDAYKRKFAKNSVDLAGALGALLDERIMPRIVIEEPWFQHKEAVFLYTDILARVAAVDGLQAARDAVSSLPEFAGVRLNVGSMRMNQEDLMFSLRLTDPEGKSRTIWVRARADQDAVEALLENERLLEERLLDALDQVHEKPEPPFGPEPDDKSIKEMAISSTTIAKFATNLAEISTARLTGGQ